MLDHLKADINTMIDLARQIENYDATLAARRFAGQPIEPKQTADDEQQSRYRRLADLRAKWGV